MESLLQAASTQPCLSGTWATKAIFNSTFIFLYSYLYFFIFLSVCVFVSLYTHTESVSPPPHIPSSPFVFAVFHFLFLHFLFLQETLTFRMKKHQWPQSYHFIVITCSWCWCFSSFYYVFIPIILTSDNKTQVTLKAN